MFTIETHLMYVTHYWSEISSLIVAHVLMFFFKISVTMSPNYEKSLTFITLLLQLQPQWSTMITLSSLLATFEDADI